MRWCSEQGIDAFRATTQEVLRFYEWYRSRVRPLSAIRRLTSIKFFYRWLQETAQRDDNPASPIKCRLPKLAPKRPFSPNQLQALLRAVLAQRDRVLVLLLLGTGCRLGEIATMRTSWIDWERGLISVEGKGSRHRWVAPGTKAMDALRHYLDGREGAVWLSEHGGTLTRSGIYLMVKRLGQRAGVPNVYTHRFRTTYAVEFDAATDGDIQSLQVLMGHSKVETTLAYSAWNRAERALAQQRRYSLSDRLAG